MAVRRGYHRAMHARNPVADLRSTIAALQISLSAAHERIRELEHLAAVANQRAAEAVEYADAMQTREYTRESEAWATQPIRDVLT